MAPSWGSGKHSLAFPSRRRRSREAEERVGTLVSSFTHRRDLRSSRTSVATSLSIGPPTVSHPYKLKPDLMGWKRAARSSCIQLSLLSVLQPHPGHLYRVSCKKILSLSPAIPFDLRLAFSGHAGCIVVGNRGDDPRSISTGDKNIFIR